MRRYLNKEKITCWLILSVFFLSILSVLEIRAKTIGKSEVSLFDIYLISNKRTQEDALKAFDAFQKSFEFNNFFVSHDITTMEDADIEKAWQALLPSDICKDLKIQSVSGVKEAKKGKNQVKILAAGLCVAWVIDQMTGCHLTQAFASIGKDVWASVSKGGNDLQNIPLPGLRSCAGTAWFGYSVYSVRKNIGDAVFCSVVHGLVDGLDSRLTTKLGGSHLTRIGVGLSAEALKCCAFDYKCTQEVDVQKALRNGVENTVTKEIARSCTSSLANLQKNEEDLNVTSVPMGAEQCIPPKLTTGSSESDYFVVNQLIYKNVHPKVMSVSKAIFPVPLLLTRLALKKPVKQEIEREYT